MKRLLFDSLLLVSLLTVVVLRSSLDVIGGCIHMVASKVVAVRGAFSMLTWELSGVQVRIADQGIRSGNPNYELS